MDAGVIVPTVLFLAIAATVITYFLSQGRTRRLLIERGMLDGRYADVLGAEARLRTLGALRWGLVLAGFALGLIVADALGFDLFYGPPGGGEGLVFLGAALGFVAYYLIARKERFGPSEPALPRSAPPAPVTGPPPAP